MLKGIKTFFQGFVDSRTPKERANEPKSTLKVSCNCGKGIKYVTLNKRKSSDYYEKRAKKMVEMRKDGDTLQKIGNKFNISRERVRQVLLKYKVVQVCRTEWCDRTTESKGRHPLGYQRRKSLCNRCRKNNNKPKLVKIKL